MDMKQAGDTLYRLRNGKRPEIVAAALQVSVNSLRNYEAGKAVPRRRIRTKIEEYYGTAQAAIWGPDVLDWR